MFDIFCKGSEVWTGHLHTTFTRYGAETWATYFREQGYTDVRIIPLNTDHKEG